MIGDVYKGNWKEGNEDGFGTKKSPDGRVYSGNWKAGKRDGYGTLKYTNYEVLVIEGNWKAGL